MEISNEPRNGSSSFLPRPIKDTVRCPECKSVFIDNNECESCGFQMGFDFLGDPLGEKSFYSIRENYWEVLGPVVKLHKELEFLDKSKFQRYQRKLLFRYNVLLDYFYNCRDYGLDDRNLYLQEFTDLIIELVRYDVEEVELWKKFENSEENEYLSHLFSSIQESISKGREVKRSDLSLFLSILNYRVFGLVRIGVIAVTFLGVIGVVAAALSFYRYMIFSY
ncbi:hypothetical protein [Halobacteriovorax sp. HLS]|uniref:hypothetical protein n=1 Tax=Halobacteriovorax sp. HLS TaxID=2234000 RepID=UPI000FD8A177|nr:hypothetical protein [Halobacteriovorax sp. HLS]